MEERIEIELDLNKTLEENASYYFENSKKFKKKAKGAYEAIKKFELEEKQKEEIEIKEQKEKSKEKKTTKIIKKTFWYMKYRWFYTSKGHLAIGGRDANTNEELIKKRLEKNDLVFHADVNGSPFFILKLEKDEREKIINNIEEYKDEIQELVDATVSFSRAWKYGVSVIDAFFVLPEQVSKKAKAGEYLQKGSFMIYGKKNIFTGILKLYVKTIKIEENNYIIISPVKEDSFIELTPGKIKVSDAAKEIKKYLEKKGIKDITLDEIVKSLPGNVDIKYLKR